MTDECDQLKSRLATLEATQTAFEKLMNERDRRYEERAKNQLDNTALALTALKDGNAAAFAAAERASTKAEDVSERRQDASNEIRAAMIDQQKHFADKELTEQKFQTLDARITALVGSRSGGMKDLFGYIVGVSGAIVAAIAILLHH
jgi:hypothetical protein